MDHTDASRQRKDYRSAVNEMGKKEFTLLKMQEYGFWPDNLPTPYEKQKNETEAEFNQRAALISEYNKLAEQIADLYEEKDNINDQLRNLKKQFSETWDYEKIRKDVAKTIMAESVARRAERKQRKALEKANASEAWKAHLKDHIVFIGKGYSGGLSHKETDEEKLNLLGLPIIHNDKELAVFLEIGYDKLRFLTFHRDVVTNDHYYRYSIPKRSGGERSIAAPKPVLKNVQRKILEMLQSIPVSSHAHGFIKEKSVVTGANAHVISPALLINLDLENFFSSVTFGRVRGMFRSFGYSGYVSSLLAMLCTDCDRMPIEIKGQIKYVKASERLLPQGSPASPMITNIICRHLDQKMGELSGRYGFLYSRYADDISLSFTHMPEEKERRKIMAAVHALMHDEGFSINNKKTRYLKKNNRQAVTGIVINNNGIGVPKAWVKKVRAAIHNASKAMESGSLKGTELMEISGMCAWLKAVNYSRYKKLIDQGMALVNTVDNE